MIDFANTIGYSVAGLRLGPPSAAYGIPPKPGAFGDATMCGGVGPSVTINGSPAASLLKLLEPLDWLPPPTNTYVAPDESIVEAMAALAHVFLNGSPAPLPNLWVHPVHVSLPVHTCALPPHLPDIPPKPAVHTCALPSLTLKIDATKYGKYFLSVFGDAPPAQTCALPPHSPEVAGLACAFGLSIPEVLTHAALGDTWVATLLRLLSPPGA